MLNRISSDYKKQLISIFEKKYPDPRTELNYKNEYQLLISVMLSAQTTDKKVNQITPALFSVFPNFSSLSMGKIADVEKIIGEINYYKTKSRHIIETAEIVAQRHAAKLPKTFDELISLPGVGRKTANVVLSELDISPAIAVDTHVFRLSHRLGLSSGKDPINVEEDLKKLFPTELWHNVHHWLILHGRRVCTARNQICSQCELSVICPSSDSKE